MVAMPPALDTPNLAMVDMLPASDTPDLVMIMVSTGRGLSFEADILSLKLKDLYLIFFFFL